MSLVSTSNAPPSALIAALLFVLFVAALVWRTLQGRGRKIKDEGSRMKDEG